MTTDDLQEKDHTIWLLTTRFYAKENRTTPLIYLREKNVSQSFFTYENDQIQNTLAIISTPKFWDYCSHETLPKEPMNEFQTTRMTRNNHQHTG